MLKLVILTGSIMSCCTPVGRRTSLHCALTVGTLEKPPLFEDVVPACRNQTVTFLQVGQTNTHKACMAGVSTVLLWSLLLLTQHP